MEKFQKKLFGLVKKVRKYFSFVYVKSSGFCFLQFEWKIYKKLFFHMYLEEPRGCFFEAFLI